MLKKTFTLTIFLFVILLSAWENVANWSRATILGTTTIVYIEPGKPNYPVINSIAACNAIYTYPGTYVRVNEGFNLSITGTK